MNELTIGNSTLIDRFKKSPWLRWFFFASAVIKHNIEKESSDFIPSSSPNVDTFPLCCAALSMIFWYHPASFRLSRWVSKSRDSRFGSMVWTSCHCWLIDDIISCDKNPAQKENRCIVRNPYKQLLRRYNSELTNNTAISEGDSKKVCLIITAT